MGMTTGKRLADCSAERKVHRLGEWTVDQSA